MGRLAILLLSCFWLGNSAAAEPATPQTPRETRVLQRRLLDAKCYAGPIDGKPSDALTKAVADCPDQRPVLRIETGMHVSFLKRMAVDAACRLAATGSTDKTVRLWSLPEGRLLRTLRVAIGPGNAGAIYAVALSPDGKWVAAGGADLDYERGRDNAVYVFEAAGGAMVARVGGFKTVINHIVFSRDGRWLAAVSKTVGVKMVDAATWTVVGGDEAYAGDSYGADFGADGQLYTVAFDHKLRRYGPGPAFAKQGEIALRGGQVPFWVAVDPSGGTLAVDYYDKARIELYDAASLRQQGVADTRRIARAVSHAGWRTDGTGFAAGGYDAGRDQQNLVTMFDRSGRRTGAPWPVDNQTITDVRGCGGGFAVASGGPSFGLFDGTGRSVFFRRSVAADMREKVGAAFTISADARRVRFGLGVGGESPVLFDLAGATLVDAAGSASGLSPAVVSGTQISGWHNNFHPTFAGRAIALDQPQSEMARALAVRPDRAQAVLASDHWLRAFDPRGGAAWKVSISQNAWGVDYSADGRILVAALGDGTIRWYRTSDGTELLALFVDKQTRAWVAWTPSGYYSASPGGEDMIGWHVNRGLDQAADFFPASRFRDRFARPDIVERVLATLDEDEAVKSADAARHVKASDAGIAESLPPVVAILSPADGASARGDVAVTYTVRSPSGLPVDAVEALVDGRPTPGARGLKRLDDLKALQACLAAAQDSGTEAAKGCRGNIVVAVPAGASEIGLFARSGTRTSEVARVRLAPTSDVESRAKPNLYALVVGISAYGNRDYALAFPAKDAHDFAAALQNQKGGFYADVATKVLADREATAKAINDGLDWLGKQVKRGDVGLVYLAGHGLLGERDRFYFLAADSDVDRLRATALSRDDIADALNGLAGKALLFLDTCHAGAIARSAQPGLDINTIVNGFSANETGVVVFAASTGRQLSEESEDWKNGAFTKALVEGLGAPGGRPLVTLREGRITTSELDAYVTDRVRALTKGAQSPVMIRPPTVPDFAIAAAR